MSQEEYNIVFEEPVAYQLSGGLQFIELARKGVLKKAVLNLVAQSGFTFKTIAGLLPVSERTLQRYADTERLSPEVSEHVILFAQVLFRAEEVLGTKEKAKTWLETPQLAMGNKTPISFLDTSFGAQFIMDELGRLEQGVFS